MLVRRVRNASDTGERGWSWVIGLPATWVCWAITPRMGRPNFWRISSGFLIVSSRKSIANTAPMARSIPTRAARSVFWAVFGSTGAVGSWAGWITATLVLV